MPFGAGDEHLFVEHVSEALVKTDILTRYQAHQIAILTGFETPNEARVIENKNPAARRGCAAAAAEYGSDGEQRQRFWRKGAEKQRGATA